LTAVAAGWLVLPLVLLCVRGSPFAVAAHLTREALPPIPVAAVLAAVRLEMQEERQAIREGFGLPQAAAVWAEMMEAFL
jgi:hypothetical protein